MGRHGIGTWGLCPFIRSFFYLPTTTSISHFKERSATELTVLQYKVVLSKLSAHHYLLAISRSISGTDMSDMGIAPLGRRWWLRGWQRRRQWWQQQQQRRWHRWRRRWRQQRRQWQWQRGWRRWWQQRQQRRHRFLKPRKIEQKIKWG